MENSIPAASHSSSKDSKNNKNDHSIDAKEEISICFGSLCLSTNNVSTAPPAHVNDSSDKLQETQVLSEESNGLSPNSSDELQESQLINEEREGLLSKTDNSWDIQEFVPGGTEWISSRSFPEKNIWGCQNLFCGEQTAENKLYGQGSPVIPLNNAPYQTNFNSSHPNSSIYGSGNWLGGYSRLNYPSGFCNDHQVANVINCPGNFSPVMENQISNNQFEGNIGGGYCNSMSNYYQASSPYFQDQKNIWNRDYSPQSSLPGFNILAMAMSREGSEQLRRVLERGSSSYIQETLRGLLPGIILLMNDPHGCKIFEMIVDRCGNHQLREIVMQFQSQSDLLLDAMFFTTGSKSMQRLIKRIRRTGMGSTITSILSRRSCELMTDKAASHVIHHCFQFLEDEANVVLYNEILTQFLPLAADIVGCITVNTCIDCVTGPRRAALLHLVGNNASFLANDPSGNFVLQRALMLKNDPITKKICYSLKGQYVDLSQRKNGSHVVEKCMESSELGLAIVLQEIFRNDKTIVLLSRNQYGNYVIQRALRVTKKHNKDLFKALIRALGPHYSSLLSKPMGRYVCYFIKDDLELLSDQ